MSLHDLHAVFVSTQNACKSIDACGNLSLSKEFKELYASKIKNEPSFSRHNEAIWLANDILELHSRGNRTVTYIPSVFFFVAEKLVPLYSELQAYRAALVRVLQQYNHTLDDTEEPSCVQYINNVAFLSDEEKHWLCKFVTDGGWWGKGRQIKRAQDFYESPLMQSASLTQETQSEVARITKQFAENPMLVSKLAVTKNSFAEELSNADRLTVALKLFQEARKAPVSTGVRYWIFSPGEQACRWDEMRDGGVMALSYEECGRDLREYADEEAIRTEFKSSEEDDASYKNHLRALTDFLNVMKPGDLVFAKKGTKTFLGVGRVTGEYEFAADAPDYKHRRAVEWLKAETVEREDAVARKTLTDVTRYGDLVRELCEAYGIADLALNSGAAWNGYWALNPGARQYFNELRKNIDKLDNDKVVEMFGGVKKNDKIVFKPMWSGSYGTGWNSLKRGLEEENSKTIETIRHYCESAADLAVFATKEDAKKRPLGFGNSVVSELLMKFHPDVAMKCGRKTIVVYHDLQLMEFKRPDDYSATEYTRALGIAADIRQRMDQFGITRMVEDKEPADYLTVNEFIAWCGDNKDLIKEEIMKQNQIKAEPEKLKTDGKKKLSDLIAGGPDSLMTMLTAALLAKPFAILAGASGTGKSRMVKKLAYMTCNADQLRSEKDETPGNYCMVAVKPNWHDSSELLGYRSAISDSHEYITPDFIKFILRAHAFPKTPFFVCLDEMNLAPVEQYFAEFLSACESIRKNREGEWVSDPLIQPGEFDKNVVNLAPDYSLPDACIKRINERGLYIPRNLFVVGTVNMDDTTHQFSRKVLDRAMTLMMDDVDFGALQNEQYERLTNDLLMNGDDIKKFIDRGEFEGKDLEKDFKELLGKLQTALKESPFAIGYRFAIESVLYRKALALLGVEAAALDATAADHMALMKILPRITGTLEERKDILGNLESFFGELNGHKLSADTLGRMKNAAGHNGDYISFWP